MESFDLDIKQKDWQRVHRDAAGALAVASCTAVPAVEPNPAAAAEACAATACAAADRTRPDPAAAACGAAAADGAAALSAVASVNGAAVASPARRPGVASGLHLTLRFQQCSCDG